MATQLGAASTPFGQSQATQPFKFGSGGAAPSGGSATTNRKF